MHKPDYDKLAEFAEPKMVSKVRWYIELGHPTGSFLTALLENNLQNAVVKADANNAAHLREWVIWMIWNAPYECWGSPEKVRAWKAARKAELREVA